MEDDSFINDASQLTQVTPACDRKRKPGKSPVDMAAIYRQSLMSPMWRDLRFQTPRLLENNKFKMVYGKRKADSQSDSEAEEVNELEDKAEFDNEADVDSPLRREEKSRARASRVLSDSEHSPPSEGGSFDESQIARPAKRLKRKRVLDESLSDDDSSKHSKLEQRGGGFSAPATPLCKSNGRTPLSRRKRPGPYGNFRSKFTSPPTGMTADADFIRSSAFSTRVEPAAAERSAKDCISVPSRIPDSSPEHEPAATAGPVARDNPTTPGLDVSSSLFSDSAVDLSDTELLGALDTSGASIYDDQRSRSVSCVLYRCLPLK